MFSHHKKQECRSRMLALWFQMFQVLPKKDDKDFNCTSTWLLAILLNNLSGLWGILVKGTSTDLKNGMVGDYIRGNTSLLWLGECNENKVSRNLFWNSQLWEYKCHWTRYSGWNMSVGVRSLSCLWMPMLWTKGCPLMGTRSILVPSMGHCSMQCENTNSSGTVQSSVSNNGICEDLSLEEEW